MSMKEFTSAVEETVEGDEEPFVEFKLDGQTLRAYHPHEGQLIFMMASMGRGQSQTSRFASMVNIMLECLRDDDRDYMESRLLTRDPKQRLPIKQVESIFEFLVEEWFARPTEPQSDSAGSPPSDGQN